MFTHQRGFLLAFFLVEPGEHSVLKVPPQSRKPLLGASGRMPCVLCPTGETGDTRMLQTDVLELNTPDTPVSFPLPAQIGSLQPSLLMMDRGRAPRRARCWVRRTH